MGWSRITTTDENNFESCEENPKTTVSDTTTNLHRAVVKVSQSLIWPNYKTQTPDQQEESESQVEICRGEPEKFRNKDLWTDKGQSVEGEKISAWSKPYKLIWETWCRPNQQRTFSVTHVQYVSCWRDKPPENKQKLNIWVVKAWKSISEFFRTTWFCYCSKVTGPQWKAHKSLMVIFTPNWCLCRWNCLWVFERLAFSFLKKLKA